VIGGNPDEAPSPHGVAVEPRLVPRKMEEGWRDLAVCVWITARLSRGYSTFTRLSGRNAPDYPALLLSA
jgi:hypothetical protein